MENVGTENRRRATSRWRTVWEEARALARTSQTLTSPANTASETASLVPLVRPASREATPCRTIRVYFIKPSKYDEQGYVLRFWKGVLPNNTLTALAALNEEYNRMRATQNVFVETVLWDEIVEGAIDAETVRTIAEKAKEDHVEVIIGMAGVQTNQYPRGRDVALQFVNAGFTVLMGGFHVSGYPDSCKFLNDCGVTTIVGEAESTWVGLLDDYLRGDLKLHYRVTSGIRAKTGTGEILVPSIEGVQLPAIDARYLTRFANTTMTTLDTSRGCPFTCSYCSVKNVMGRTMRARDSQSAVDWIRDAADYHGIDTLFLVDDDFFRSPQWEPVLLGMAELKQQGRNVNFMMQVDIDAGGYADLRAGEVDSSKHQRSRRFVELVKEAGGYCAFVGFESFNPLNLMAATKFQNTERRERNLVFSEAKNRVLEKYRRVVNNWHDAGIAVHCGYMIGFPHDTADSGREAALDLIDIGVDLASFFVVTPLPGTEDHIKAVEDGTITDWDFNWYDSDHMVFRHPVMTHAEVLNSYRDAYTTFYSPWRMLKNTMTFSGGRGLNWEARDSMTREFLYWGYSYRRGRHPMLGGLWKMYDEKTKRRVITDDEARALYLADMHGRTASEVPVLRMS
ncbi:MAG: radical SAM protein [Deltaproteobacteria bacterium]|nr:radical SAM protein [Deltaproteobacteria bacterium]